MQRVTATRTHALIIKNELQHIQAKYLRDFKNLAGTPLPQKINQNNNNEITSNMTLLGTQTPPLNNVEEN